MKIETWYARCCAAARREMGEDDLPRPEDPAWDDLAERICRAVDALCRRELSPDGQGAAAGLAEAYEKELRLPRAQAEELARFMLRRMRGE